MAADVVRTGGRLTVFDSVDYTSPFPPGARFSAFISDSTSKYAAVHGIGFPHFHSLSASDTGARRNAFAA